MGNIEITMTMGDKKFDNVFKSVLYILKIVKNLLSMSKGDLLGNVFVFGKISRVVERDQKVVQVDLHENYFYKLNCNVKLYRRKSVSNVNTQL
jgi:hypothetical protein